MRSSDTVGGWFLAAIHAPLSAFWLLWLVLAGHGVYTFITGQAGLFTAFEGALAVAGIIRLLGYVRGAAAWPDPEAESLERRQG